VSERAPLSGLVDHLFRHEAGRLAAALVRILGPANVDLAEDVVQETLCHALETWKLGRVPANPAAWLRTAARNRALDLVRRGRTRARLAPDIARMHEDPAESVDAAFTDEALDEQQLRMMFACCDARLKSPVQIALILKLLCGFGMGEIAQAFLASAAAIEKRLARGKAALRRVRALRDLSDPQVERRLDAVLDALYLLFNEGYHGGHAELAVRAELCAEALRLARLLPEHPTTAQPRTFALLALMCLHAARLPARVDDRGALIPLEEQDRSKWDRDLAAEGAQWLSRAAAEPPTPLLLEAAIAAEHSFAPSFAETDWRAIAALYDALYAQKPSPVVGLNRAIARGQLEGPERALSELQSLPGRERLVRYPFYAAALGELHRRAAHGAEAAEQFRRALRLARSPAEREYFERKLAAMGNATAEPSR
jgi:RNA polymerase sigma-70 factor (ECF subfamily)